MRHPILILLGSVLAMSTQVGCSGAEHDEDIVRREKDIINGTTPVRGTRMDMGVVTLGNCTGTLVTNQHVLTARHCVRQWITGTGWSTSLRGGIGATLEGETAFDDQTSNALNVFEGNSSALDEQDTH